MNRNMTAEATRDCETSERNHDFGFNPFWI